MSKEAEKKLRKINTKKFKLNKVEKEVLHYLFVDFMTSEQVAKKRGTSVRAVEQAIQRIKKKGFWNPPTKTFANKGGYQEQLSGDNKYRLHAEQFYIRILDSTSAYQNKISKEKTGVFYKDNNTIIFNPKSIQVISKKDFWGSDAQESQQKSANYWMNFIKSIEQELKVVLVKEKYQNIRYTKRGEYADLDNKLVQDVHSKNQRLIVRGSDGKVWFETDKSFNRNEGEYKHPVYSNDDSTLLDETFNDLEDNYSGVVETMNDIRDRFQIDEPFKPSQIVNMLGSLTSHVNKLQTEVQNINSELGASQKTSIEMFNNLIQVLHPQKNVNNSQSEFKPENSSMFY